MRKYICTIIVISLFLSASCSSTISNIATAQLFTEPQMMSYNDPGFNPEPYRTFSVIPYSAITGENKQLTILDKQMLFALRNVMEERGYDFVNIDQLPDFFATIDASMRYEQIDVPARQITVPKWVPSREIESYGTSSGYVSGVGAYSGSSTITTTIPGYLTNETYTLPGYSTGLYFPVIVVAAYDRKTLANVWWGKGVASSKNNDIRIASQWVLKQLVGTKFPALKYQSDECKGQDGTIISTFTIDGNNYYPTVLHVIPDSPAQKANIKVSDFIVAINGKPTVNKSPSEIRSMSCGKEGDNITLRLFRNGKMIDVSMKLVNDDILFKNDK